LTTLRVGWDDFYRLDGTIPTSNGGTGMVHGELETKVSRIELGPHG
jgi:hypothetical protein